MIGQSAKGALFALERTLNLATNIRPISYLKTHAAEMLQQINDTQNPIGILKLLAQAEHDVEVGGTVSHEDAIGVALRAIDRR